MAAAVVTLSFLVTLLGSAIAGFYCPTGWLMFGKSCYRISSDFMSWNMASETCMSLNATLTVISSVKENEFVSDSQSSSAHWIGLHVAEPGGPFVLANDSITKPTFTSWASDQPNSGAINCVYLATRVYRQYEHGWGDYYCRKQYPFICQKTKGRSQCDANWLSQGGKCYRVNSTDTRDWFSARAFCQQQEGDLAVIDNMKDNQFLTNALQRGLKAWIGLWDQHMDFRWRWLDQPGRPTWTDWIRGQPVNSKRGRSKHCACAMGYYSRRGRWKGDVCMAHYKFVCKGKTKEMSCPRNWRSRSMNGARWCYFVSNDLVIWSHARNKCQTMMKGADLVWVENYSETSFMKGFLTGTSSDDCYWIGLNDHAKEGVWAWLDEGAATGYTNWYSTPSRINRDSCVMMYAYTERYLGKWVNAVCHTTFGYICEITSGSCLSNSTNNPLQYGGHCYKVSSEARRDSWNSARYYCKNTYNADLVTIETRGEMEFLTALIAVRKRKDGYWIGLHSPNAEGLYQWLDEDTSTADYGNWAKGEPHLYPQENCVYNSAKFWSDNDCFDRKPFVCEKPVTGGYSFYDFSMGDTVFKAITDHRVPRQTNFTELCTDILGEGADLALITSQAELETIGQELSLRGVGSDSLWLDVSADVGMAKLNAGNCVCMFMQDPGLAQFGSDFCCRLKPFLCKRKMNATNQLFDFMFNRTIYKFVTLGKKSNPDAKAECEKIFGPKIPNGQLAEISSHAELGMASAEIRARHLGEDLRYWVGSGPVSIETNSTGEPCYVITYHGYPYVPWDNHHLDVTAFNCSQQSRFLCQKRLGPNAGITDQSVWEQLMYEAQHQNKQTLVDYVMDNINSNCNALCIKMILVLLVMSLLCFGVGFIIVAAAYRWNCSPIARMLNPGRKHGDVMYLHADSIEET